MAKISISSISIENVGPFRQKQILALSVAEGRPIILVRALNGSGKTTLLTSLQIGLYGHKAIAGGRRSDYDQLIRGMYRKDATGPARIEVGVVVEIGGVRRHLFVQREWIVSPETLRETLTVIENDTESVEFSQSWGDFIESILPVELIQLFLFDGEKIEALANPDRLPDLLKRATEVFLGIGGIDSLNNDLKAWERRAAFKNKSASADYENITADVMKWEKQAQELKEKIQILAQGQGAARNVVDQMHLALEKYTADAQKNGLAAYEKAAALRADAVAAKQRSDEMRTNLAALLSDPILPLSWLSGLWADYRDAWARDQHSRHVKLLAKEFKKRDQRIMSALTGAIPPSAIASIRNAFDDDLRLHGKGQKSTSVALLDVPLEDVERQLQMARSRLSTELSRAHRAQQELDSAEERIGQIPAEEQVAAVLSDLQARTRAVAKAEEQLETLTRQLDEVQGQLSHVQLRLNAAQERLGDGFRDQALEAKSLAASARVRQTLTVFKDRLLASKAEWLSSVISAEFRNLMRKRNLIASVIVDPVTYRVSIEDRHGRDLPMERLSAGERQLLAVSVLSALIKERKGRFPVVVDTPLARLDQLHRSTLIKRFFATVSHQVVVLSTDQEVTGQAYDALKPFTSAEYSLNFDDAAGHTRISVEELV